MKFPEGYVTHHAMLDSCLKLTGFQRFISAIKLLEYARSYLEFNRGWIGENVSTENTEGIVQGCQEWESRLREIGWGDAAASALFHAVEDFESLRQAVELALPDAPKNNPFETVKVLVKNCIE